MDRTPTPAKRRQDDEEMEITTSELGRSPAFLFQLFENSLKPLLTPDKGTTLTIFCIYMQNMENKMQNMQENMQNMQ
jgi:hypothetical protein